MNSRWNRWLGAGLLAGAGVAALVLFAFNPERVPIYPVCLFHRWTGLDCPGCGSLRALHQLLHGNFVEALRLNALLVLSLPLFAWVGFRLVRQQMQGTPGHAVGPVYIWIYLGLWIAFGVLRELPGPLFAAFAH